MFDVHTCQLLLDWRIATAATIQLFFVLLLQGGAFGQLRRSCANISLSIVAGGDMVTL